jgi:hypothetical protein
MHRISHSSWATAAVLAAVGIAFLVVQAPAGAQAQGGAQAGPAAQAPGGGGRGRAGGGGRGGGRGGTPIVLSELRKIPAETTAAAVTDPNWTVPRTSWGHPALEGIWTSDDMRGVPTSRPKGQMDRESLTPEEFARRAGQDEGSRDRAVNQETILRNEFGVRTFGYTSVVVEPGNGQIPAITPAAAARRKAQAGIGTFGTRPLDTFEDFTLYDRCITRGVGGISPVLYGNGVRIAQTPNEVTITYEMIHDTRVIPLDDRPRLGPNIKLWMGDARGRWEGDTLVVETTNFTDRTSIQGLHSDQLTLTEWFTRIDPEMIDYRIRVEDPATWTAPFTLRYTITQQPDYDIYEYGCHEGNTAVSQGLSTERTFQREEDALRAKGLPVPPRPNRNMEVYGAPDRSLTVRDVNSGN